LATFILIPGLPACCGLDRLAGRRAEHSPARHGPSAMQDDQLGSTFTDRRIFIIMHLSPPPAWLARFLPHSASSAIARSARPLSTTSRRPVCRCDAPPVDGFRIRRECLSPPAPRRRSLRLPGCRRPCRRGSFLHRHKETQGPAWQ
jgi:hypothetical protein